MYFFEYDFLNIYLISIYEFLIIVIIASSKVCLYCRVTILAE